MNCKYHLKLKMEHLRRPVAFLHGFFPPRLLFWATALFPALAFSESALLAQWKQAVAARLRFETLHPEAGRLFAGQPASESSPFVDSLRGPIWSADSSLRGWNLEAQALALSRSRPQEADELIRELASRWAPYPGWLQEAALTADRGGAGRLGDSLRLALRRALFSQGYQRVPEFAMTSLWHARTLMRADRDSEARAALDQAEAFDPSCPWVPWLRLEAAYRERGPFGVAIGDLWDLFKTGLGLQRFYDNQLAFCYNALHGLRLGFMIFGFLCLALLLARYFTRLAHPWAERLPAGVDLNARYAAIALVVFSAAVAGAGLGVVALAVFPWIWPHANRGERRLMRWLLAGLFLLPPALFVERSFLRPWDPADGLHGYHQAYVSGYDPAVLRLLEDKRSGAEEDAPYRTLALSLQYKKQGNYRRAEEIASGVEAHPAIKPLLEIHRANLAFLRFDYVAAEKILEQTRQTGSGWVEAWFNASQTALFQNNSSRNKQFLNKASEVDPALLTAFLKENDALFAAEVPPNRRAMDPMLRFSSAFDGTWRQGTGVDFLLEPVPSGLLSFPGGLWFLACAASVAAVMFRSRHTVISRGKLLFECKICGKIMCRTCRKGVHCEACFKTVSGVSEAKMRVQLIQRLQTRARSLLLVLFRGLNVVTPGGGWLFLGRIGPRLFWLLALSLILAAAHQMHHLVIEYPAFVAGALPALPWIVLVALYTVTVLGSLLPGRGADALPAPAESGGDLV